MTSWTVRWETVAGNGSRTFGTKDEAMALMADLIDHGIEPVWVYEAYGE